MNEPIYQLKGYLHEIVEPNGRHLTMYSMFRQNPWAHWPHLLECNYKCTWLYNRVPGEEHE